MIGFDIGGTKCAVCTGYEKDGRIVVEDKRVIKTDRGVSPYETVDRLCGLAEEMTNDLSLIGISCGGPLDSEKGVIMSPPNLPGWDNVDICEYLRSRYGGKVNLQNDANACAYAEWRYGAGKGTKNMIFLTFGTGLGAGLILNGALYTGTNDMAGEAGHIRLADCGPVGYGKAGSFEGFCSGGGIAKLGRAYAEERLCKNEPVSFCSSPDELDDITAKSIAEAADAGYEDAKKIYEKSGEMLGRGLSVLIDLLNPERIVIGSVFSRSEALLRKPMEEALRRECIPYSLDVCKIVPSALGDRIGDIAALSTALL
ncbi:MAG: ROK family protein [Clostridia bacterium]|nr:ROK family protein [Clostridia bacterium]